VQFSVAIQIIVRIYHSKKMQEKKVLGEGPWDEGGEEEGDSP
jgi:hypothetical protein